MAKPIQVGSRVRIRRDDGHDSSTPYIVLRFFMENGIRKAEIKPPRGPRTRPVDAAVLVHEGTP